MFSHIMVGTRDLESLTRFYDAVLAPIGLERGHQEDDGGPVGHTWRRPGTAWPHFIVQYPFNERPATWGNGVQVSFAAPSQDAVDRAWKAAIDNGGNDEGAPGPRPHYGSDYYGAYCRDPEGNKLCFVHTAELARISL
ncbi:VOC family protein [Sinorhizobium garamanticum]|uniref:VOC family protein n=1 Tax=Sinorhizobium garamanticum TaxID=680247 RepID=A0ABY8D6N9_9HYPH|nr:VOC family protein [Sinorhizobium garamanticum]WEX85737.1 VOC family protein [Sinorhizobium garamanticum]